jgi:hypothetical protein
MIFASACVGTQPAGSGSEVAELKAQIKALQTQVTSLETEAKNRQSPAAETFAKQQDGVNAAERLLQAKVLAEQASYDQNGSDTAKRKLEEALSAADHDPDNKGKYAPPGGSVKELKCYATICRGQTTHVNDAAYRAFAQAAFTGGDRKYSGWFAIIRLESAGQAKTALFYLGKVAKESAQ